ncbi:uncharacterized protein LOC124931186 [Impatiens glandulifera]|uniref:uncharacterized protein LOC124931186 n=1 Tax=Impatiens glandulifera TaxID=253017 RepID=UPI001FB0C26C|nr:uncharacterized protein LOC124931186 [Impatiens glandulifera]
MGSPSATTGSVPSPTDETPRVKFLCSFLGSILPRPQDGKLRYVGGETRIVSVSRDISYEELMIKLRELYEGAGVLKYQQPDEDLDALVSVVNDDDVINMMEEYDKLGFGDGFTRLRIFLFSHPEQEASSQFMEIDDRDTERRYVDALNSHSESPEFRANHLSETPVTLSLEDVYASDQYYGQVNFDNGIPNHRNNYDLPLQQFNLHHLRVPHLNSAQHQQPPPQRYNNEFDGNRSPAYHSPRHAVDYPNSPSSTLYRPQYPEFPEKTSEEYGWQQQQMNHISPYEQQQLRFSDNMAWYPSGGLPNGVPCFPGNILDGTNRNQAYHDQQLPIEQPHMANGQPGSSYIPNSEANYHHGLYSREQNDHRVPFNDTHNRARGWNMQHIAIPQTEEPRSTIALDGMQHDHHGVLSDGHHLNPTYVHNEDPRYIRSGPEQGNRYGNVPYSRGADGFVRLPHGQSNDPIHNVLSYEASTSGQLSNGMPGPGFIMSNVESNNPRMLMGMDNQNPCQAPYFIPPTHNQERQYMIGHGVRQSCDMLNHSSHVEPVQLSNLASSSSNNKFVPPTLPHLGSRKDTTVGENIENELDQNKTANECSGPVMQVKEAALECHDSVKGKAEGNGNYEDSDTVAAKEEIGLNKSNTLRCAEGKEENGIRSEAIDAPPDIEVDSDNECSGESKIEPTKAEEEAIARGLQTIRNDDLEEVKELGSGTYGAVFHGKWKGSDVAIKRIKASCFAGRPSERERLIADFWKEALILSSLHHPNVVSFYGIVRDGPDGSLATVTEFMINGSLKQFIHKKDRTIDRRKRLIIAMDAAFGMEYLHGKNIVHFDLKCENLLVNMRDPHRPVCKIGDLGLSKVKQHTLVSGGVRGTLPWMAPELLSGKSNMVSDKIDVYSFGIVMWELLTGEEPYADMHCASLIAGIVNNTLRPTIPTWCDPEWKSLMEGCWACDPTERPSFTEISRKLRTMAAAINVK